MLGGEEELPGTLVQYLCDLGVTTLGFEAGQHEDPVSVDRAEAAIWIAMEAAGIVERGTRPEVAEARRTLTESSRSLPRIVEMRYRKPVDPDDQFQMAPGFASFQTIEEGQLMAHDREGPIKAATDGFLLMPLYQEQGQEGYFIVRPVRAFWLALSAKAQTVGNRAIPALAAGGSPTPRHSGSIRRGPTNRPLVCDGGFSSPLVSAAWREGPPPNDVSPSSRSRGTGQWPFILWVGVVREGIGRRVLT